MAPLIYGPHFTSLGIRAEAGTHGKPEVFTLWLYRDGL